MRLSGVLVCLSVLACWPVKAQFSGQWVALEQEKPVAVCPEGWMELHPCNEQGSMTCVKFGRPLKYVSWMHMQYMCHLKGGYLPEPTANNQAQFDQLFSFYHHTYSDSYIFLGATDITHSDLWKFQHSNYWFDASEDSWEVRPDPSLNLSCLVQKSGNKKYIGQDCELNNLPVKIANICQRNFQSVVNVSEVVSTAGPISSTLSSTSEQTTIKSNQTTLATTTTFPVMITTGGPIRITSASPQTTIKSSQTTSSTTINLPTKPQITFTTFATTSSTSTSTITNFATTSTSSAATTDATSTTTLSTLETTNASTTTETFSTIPLTTKTTLKSKSSSKRISSTEVVCRWPMDIVFVVDESSSVKTKEFHKSKKFVTSIVNTMFVSQQYTQVSLVTFSNQSYVDLHLNATHNKQELMERIEGIEQEVGGTGTHHGLGMVYRESFKPKNGGGRKEAVRFLILITDGKAEDQELTLDYAEKLKKSKNVHIFTIGFDKASRKELRSIASNKDHFMWKKGADIDYLDDSLRKSVTNQICEDVRKFRKHKLVKRSKIDQNAEFGNVINGPAMRSGDTQEIKIMESMLPASWDQINPDGWMDVM